MVRGIFTNFSLAYIPVKPKLYPLFFLKVDFISNIFSHMANISLQRGKCLNSLLFHCVCAKNNASKIDPKSCLCVGHFNKSFRLIINKFNAGEKQPHTHTYTYTRTHTEKVAHLHLNMACLFLKRKTESVFILIDETVETRSKQLRETLFSSAMSSLTNTKSLLEKKAYITAYPQNNPLH